LPFVQKGLPFAFALSTFAFFRRLTVYRKDLIWLYASGVLMLLLTGYLAWGYVQPEWKDYQDEFRAWLRKFGA
jgi:hypothetical protein